MAFIDELIGGGLPYGMTIKEEPKAHDAIDELMQPLRPDIEEFIKSAIKGSIGGPSKKLLTKPKETAKQMAERKKYWGQKAHEQGKYTQTKEQKYWDDIAEQEYEDALFQDIPYGEGGSFFEKYLRSLFD